MYKFCGNTGEIYKFCGNMGGICIIGFGGMDAPAVMPDHQCCFCYVYLMSFFLLRAVIDEEQVVLSVIKGTSCSILKVMVPNEHRCCKPIGNCN